jgi:hypothetical protein
MPAIGYALTEISNKAKVKRQKAKGKGNGTASFT